jgi:hypothetical protein
MEEASPRHTTNPGSKMCLETNSEEEDESVPSPRRKSMTDTIRKSFQMFTTVKLDESDEEGAEGEEEQGGEEEEEDKPASMRFFFCCA